MHHQLFRFFLCLLSAALASCATDAGNRFSESAALPAAKRAASGAEPREDDGRKRIYRASQTIEVADVAASAQRVEEQVRERKGYVESSSVRSNGDSHATLSLRVPANESGAVMEDFAALGNEVERRVTAEDTTSDYYDLEARLKNSHVLRDRLRDLLDSAETVSEVLQIEKEIARVQSDLDAMQSKFKLMQSQVRLAKIDLTLRTREIPGPLGAAGKGIWWTFRKLFVLK